MLRPLREKGGGGQVLYIFGKNVFEIIDNQKPPVVSQTFEMVSGPLGLWGLQDPRVHEKNLDFCQ